VTRPTKVAFDSGVSFQLAAYAQDTAPIASWKLTPRLLSGASRVPILRSPAVASPASRLKAGLRLIDPKAITARPCRIPDQADSMESRTTEYGQLARDYSLAATIWSLVFPVTVTAMGNHLQSWDRRQS
jgi:hypothetical protein